jgi:hypothetical protein
METGTDAARREHHRGLILEYLKAAFPRCYVAHLDPGAPMEHFLIDSGKPVVMYRLFVRGNVLDDKHRDHELTRALEHLGVADLLRQCPTGHMTLGYNEQGAISAEPQQYTSPD